MRKFFAGLLVLALLGVAAVVGVGWYFSGQVLNVNRVPEYNLTVQAVDTEAETDTVTLPWRSDLENPGRYDIRWDGGRAIVGDLVSITETDGTPTSVTRELEEVAEGDLEVGAAVYWGQNIYVGDPQSALGLGFTEVAYETELGPAPAWFIPPADSPLLNVPAEEITFDPVLPLVITVHGINGSREDSLRLLPPLHESGYPVLAITYRNDVDAPPSEDGLHHLGDTEWKDVEAAITWAQDRGAERIVLLAQSMGGAIALQTADRAANKDAIVGLILDSPVIDWRDVFDYQGNLSGLPDPMVGVAARVIEFRIDIDLDDFDWVARADELAKPTVIIHGPQDLYVPWGPALNLAEAREDVVTLEQFDLADHVRNINSDPKRYGDVVVEFIDPYAIP